MTHGVTPSIIAHYKKVFIHLHEETDWHAKKAARKYKMLQKGQGATSAKASRVVFLRRIYLAKASRVLLSIRRGIQV